MKNYSKMDKMKDEKGMKKMDPKMAMKMKAKMKGKSGK